jgi:hypothetical protein
MKAEDLMTRTVCTCSQEDSLTSGARPVALRDARVGSAMSKLKESTSGFFAQSRPDAGAERAPSLPEARTTSLELRGRAPASG